AVLALIATDVGERRFEDAEQRLAVFLARRDVLPPMRASAITQLGDLRDRQGKTAEAFAAYTDSRSVWSRFYGPQCRDEMGSQLARRLSAMLAATPLARRSAA